jgi:hypothetical protein
MRLTIKRFSDAVTATFMEKIKIKTNYSWLFSGLIQETGDCGDHRGFPQFIIDN